jgi:hypothetical protein
VSEYEFWQSSIEDSRCIHVEAASSKTGARQSAIVRWQDCVSAGFFSAESARICRINSPFARQDGPRAGACGRPGSEPSRIKLHP